MVKTYFGKYCPCNTIEGGGELSPEGKFPWLDGGDENPELIPDKPEFIKFIKFNTNFFC